MLLLKYTFSQLIEIHKYDLIKMMSASYALIQLVDALCATL